MVKIANVVERKIFRCSMVAQNSCTKLLRLCIGGHLIDVFCIIFKIETPTAFFTWFKIRFDLLVPESNRRKQSVALRLRRSMKNKFVHTYLLNEDDVVFQRPHLLVLYPVACAAYGIGQDKTHRACKDNECDKQKVNLRVVGMR